MQTARIVQAVVLMMIVAMAASCAASKEYTSKLFTPRIPIAKDSQAVALRFFEIDSTEKNDENWVTTDIIMGRDTVSRTYALDKFAKEYPATPVTVAKNVKEEQVKSNSGASETKPIPSDSEPVAKNPYPGEIRTKRTRE